MKTEALKGKQVLLTRYRFKSLSILLKKYHLSKGRAINYIGTISILSSTNKAALNGIPLILNLNK
jgi:hypothetical protein